MAKKKISPEVQAIISAADAGHFATTIALVKKFLAENPESQRAWLDLGHAHVQLAQYDEAEQAFKKAIELVGEGESDVIFGQLGNLFKAKGDFSGAATWYQRQIEADSNDATGYVFLANLQMRQGEFEQAEETLTSALNCELGIKEEVHYSLGLLYRSTNRFPDAKSQFESALDLDPGYAAAKSALKDVKTAANL